MIVKR